MPWLQFHLPWPTSVEFNHLQTHTEKAVAATVTKPQISCIPVSQTQSQPQMASFQASKLTSAAAER